MSLYENDAIQQLISCKHIVFLDHNHNVKQLKRAGRLDSFLATELTPDQQKFVTSNLGSFTSVKISELKQKCKEIYRKNIVFRVYLFIKEYDICFRMFNFKYDVFVSFTSDQIIHIAKHGISERTLRKRFIAPYGSAVFMLPNMLYLQKFNSRFGDEEMTKWRHPYDAYLILSQYLRSQNLLDIQLSTKCESVFLLIQDLISDGTMCGGSVAGQEMVLGFPSGLTRRKCASKFLHFPVIDFAYMRSHLQRSNIVESGDEQALPLLNPRFERVSLSEMPIDAIIIRLSSFDMVDKAFAARTLTLRQKSGEALTRADDKLYTEWTKSGSQQKSVVLLFKHNQDLAKATFFQHPFLKDTNYIKATALWVVYAIAAKTGDNAQHILGNLSFFSTTIF